MKMHRHPRPNDEPLAKRQASAHSAVFSDRLLRIRQRVADGAYDNAAVIAIVASMLLDSGDLL